MVAREIIAGDSYAIARPLYLYALTNIGGGAFDLTHCTVMTTFKPQPDSDLTDAAAVIEAQLTVDDAGTVTLEDGLLLGEMVDGDFVPLPATAGKFVHRLTAAQSAGITVDTPFVSDVQVIDYSLDPAGEVTTFLYTADTLTVIPSVTNRSPQ